MKSREKLPLSLDKASKKPEAKPDFFSENLTPNANFLRDLHTLLKANEICEAEAKEMKEKPSPSSFLLKMIEKAEDCCKNATLELGLAFVNAKNYLNKHQCLSQDCIVSLAATVSECRNAENNLASFDQAAKRAYDNDCLSREDLALLCPAKKLSKSSENSQSSLRATSHLSKQPSKICKDTISLPPANKLLCCKSELQEMSKTVAHQKEMHSHHQGNSSRNHVHHKKEAVSKTSSERSHVNLTAIKPKSCRNGILQGSKAHSSLQSTKKSAHVKFDFKSK